MEQLSPFDTPIFVRTLDGMSSINTELCQRLIDESERVASIERSNVGGWHSPPDLGRRQEPCYQQLMQAIIDSVQEVLERSAAARNIPVVHAYRFGVYGWAMVMRDGDYTILHDHPEAHFSVAYYPDPGDQDASAPREAGGISFVDPRRGSAPIPGLDLYPTQFTIHPKPGMLVVFPGWLQHFVHPYRGERPRVSISCNIRLEPMQQPPRPGPR